MSEKTNPIKRWIKLLVFSPSVTKFQLLKLCKRSCKSMDDSVFSTFFILQIFNFLIVSIFLTKCVVSGFGLISLQVLFIFISFSRFELSKHQDTVTEKN